MDMKHGIIILSLAALALLPLQVGAAPAQFFDQHCYDCHDADAKKGGLDLTALKRDFTNAGNFARWLKVHDRIESGEMPPKKKPRPAAGESATFLKELGGSLITAERARMQDERTRIRRLTRGEYENTMRDLFDMPGLALAGDLPPDGSAHGFDNNAEALDISHVNVAKYMEAADKVLDMAIATQPKAPEVRKVRLSLAQPGGFVAHVIMNGDGVLLRDGKPDPEFPPAGETTHLDEGAHERMGTFERGSTVGLFRHEDESFSPYFAAQVTIYPGLYRARWSVWSFGWDKGAVLPARGTEAARLAVVQLTGDGRGGQHPSYLQGYFDAPSLKPTEHEVKVWMNANEIFGFNAASLAPAVNYSRKGHAMAFTGPGVAVDWLEVEGPLHSSWPTRAHKQLFADLPLVKWSAEANPGARPPLRKTTRQIGAGKNRPDPDAGLWSVHANEPLVDAYDLLRAFLPQAFRQPVEEEVTRGYVARVEERLKAGDCFESAMRWAYRAALCSPDFLYHVEGTNGTDATDRTPAKDKSSKSHPSHLSDYALASRLSYFLWGSQPDAQLTKAAELSTLAQPAILRAQVERMLGDAKSQRFIEDFLGQWLKLRSIAANDPDKKLYPEFNPYLQDSMVAETRAYFRELLEKNLSATHLVRSDFAMLNERLAAHYGIPGVTGTQIRRVALPADSLRGGGFLTQGAILKVTANGTTTSPVVRGAFVMARILGQPPEPPPAAVAAVEPDVRGTTTVREQLEKHRSDKSCAGCHAKIDPAGFALEAFDVIGGQRTRYRSIGSGDEAPRGVIDPFIGISFKLGPTVDASGVLPDERKFADFRELQTLLAADPARLLKNLAQQLAIYSTGRDLAFSDRDEIAGIVARTQQQGGGIRTLIHELAGSALFQTR